MALKKIVVDSEDELRKLSEIVPSATVFFRLRADDPTSRVRLSEKFGLGVPEARAILQVAVDLSVKVSGICFHVGSAASDPGAYVRAIAMAREVYDYNETRSSKHPISIMHIGGGFIESNFQVVAPAVRSAADMYFGGETGVQWVAEPGRFIVSEAFYLVCRVLGTRKRLVESAKLRGVGTFGATDFR
ncbi:ornithine decarboxylase [Aspergillus awamori]|uniref:Ornithine decarboxylase n=1 Tax=Aspergillus awamori TaxID=105351 RepID=A0A401L7S1_ASPAW|nr:ornithine decarboxylase [Aspergillus awamori]